MKKIFFALATIVALSACVREELPQPKPSEGETFDLSFSVVIPEMTSTRAMGNEVITDLHLYIFDENGYLSQPKQATLANESDGNTWEDGNATAFVVEDVYESAQKRTIHFVANLPENAKTSFGSEQELINTMYTEGNAEAFWQRVVLEDGFSSTTSIQNIPLVRNYAKMTLVNEASNFSNAQFIVCNTPDRGTVAPYIVSQQAYATYPATDYATITATGYIGHEPAGMTLGNNTFTTAADGGHTFDANPKYMYERTQVGTTLPTYVIIKGTFGGKTGYYKIDLIDANNNYYNILRNFEYKITIKEVVASGYSTAADAAKYAASNNVNFAIETKDLTSITNGSESLYVSATQIIVNDSNTEFTLKYKYIPDLSKGTPSNGSVTLTGFEAGDVFTKYVVASSDDTAGDYKGWRTITFTSATVGTSAKDQTVTIVGGDLARMVQLVLTPAVSLNDFYVTQQKMGSGVHNKSGADIDVNIVLPRELYPGMFPLEFYILSDKLTITPNALRNSLPVATGLKVTGEPDGSSSYFGYYVTIEWDDYAIYGDDGKVAGYNQTFPYYFKSNTDASASNIVVYNRYFGSTSYAFTNAALLTFTLNAVNDSTNSVRLVLPNGLDFGGVTQEVTLTYYPYEATLTAATGATVQNGKLYITPEQYAAAKQFTLTFEVDDATYVTASHPAMQSATRQIQ